MNGFDQQASAAASKQSESNESVQFIQALGAEVDRITRQCCRMREERRSRLLNELSLKTRKNTTARRGHFGVSSSAQIEVEEIWRRSTEMAAIMGLHQRGREDGRKAKKRKHSRSKNKPMESLRSRLAVNILWCLTFLLFVLPAASSVTVEGLKGSSITLPCNSSNGEHLTTLLTFGFKTAYGLNQHEHFKGRVHKRGSCDLLLQDLKTTDAGKYTSKVFANGQQLDSYTYDVHVKVNLTGRTGEELMFELPLEAKNVTHFTNPDWTEVWRRGRGVLTDQLTDNNSRLTIKHFSSSDAGTYRVLNSTGGILVTVTVTEPSTSSKDKHEDEPHDGEQVSVGVWIGIGALVVLVGLVAFAVIKIRQHLNRNNDSY